MWALLLACAHRPPQEPSPPETAPKAIYFVMVDRFANGDPTNDANANPADPVAFHGGDLQGLLEKLDYIQALGFDSIWLSPIAQMRTEPFFGNGAFHGYWVQDPSRIDPRFGDERTLRQLSDAIHQRGMKLILDVVYNHVSFDAPLRGEKPEWFHPALPIQNWSDPVEVVTHEVHGLPDLDQDRPEVVAWIEEWSRKWLAMARPDGFRIDAVRHMPTTFLHNLFVNLRAEAGADFYLLGEVFDGNPLVVTDTLEKTGLSSVFDFPLHYAMVDVFCKDQHPGRIASVLSLDPLYGDPTRLVPFLDNHDLPRLRSACGEQDVRVEAALSFLFSMRGTPSVTWGTESGLTGEKEPENRKSMEWGAEAPFAAALREGLKERGPLWSRGRSWTLELSETRLVLARACSGGDGCKKGGESGLIVVQKGQGSWRVPAEMQVRRTLRGPVVTEGSLHFPQGGVAVLELEDPLPPPETVPLELDLPEGVRMVGAGPLLGNWNPELGATGEGGHIRWEAEEGAVLAYKLVRGQPGSWQWEDGPDRYLLVQAKMGIQTITFGVR
jgi:glycosidase